MAALQNFDTGWTARATSPEAGTEASILTEIKMERRRQEAKWGTRSNHPGLWLIILTEEVGEVARAILERDGV